jgi:hypothetical protein
MTTSIVIFITMAEYYHAEYGAPFPHSRVGSVITL